MIVECINDKNFRVEGRKLTRGKTPIKGGLYEVIEVVKEMFHGTLLTFYILHGFRNNQLWHESYFREVDVMINEIYEVLEKEVTEEMIA